ncbi:MAG: hypothetical protein IPI26_08790 [Elusimicrobia bacterium]|nr:hypothetical protein [Elusimicrobiota bacterium]
MKNLTKISSNQKSVWRAPMAVFLAGLQLSMAAVPARGGEFTVFEKSYERGAPRADRRGRGGEEFQDRFSVLNPKAKWRVQTTVEGREAPPRMELNDRRLPPRTPEEGAPVRLNGLNDVSVRFERRGADSAGVRVFGFDDVKPTAAWESPAAGSASTGTVVAVLRVGDDRSGVGPGGVAITLDGVDVRNLFTGPTSAVLSGKFQAALAVAGGAHRLEARVTDGAGNETTAAVNFGANTNTAPVAEAGAAVTVTVGDVVALDGSGSSDAEGTPLTYVWDFQERPAGSTATLTGADTATPIFTADRAGIYKVRLVVSDGSLTSGPDTVDVTARAANTAPVAEAGAAVTVTVGDVVALDGSGSSDAEGAPLTYVWDFQERPAGSTATLTGADTATPIFTADRAGIYKVRLVVSDGSLTSAPDTVDVTARAANTAPAVNAGADQRVTATNATLNGTATDDGLPVGGALTVAWTAAGAGVTFANAASAGTTVQFSTGGVYTLRLTATDGALTAWDETVVTVDLTPVDPTLPPDPVTVAPPIDPTVATDLAQTTAFLYRGANPIQTGVSSTTFRPEHAAVVRGRVLKRDGGPLTGVTVTVLNHPEFGATKSRADGGYDLAVNGGSLLTLTLAKEGFLPVQRKVQANWRDWSVVEDAVMIPVDGAVTTVFFGTPESSIAQGSAVTDGRGTRRAALYFPPNVGAFVNQFPLPPQPMMELNIRATEYTVGDNGPAAMPGELPPTTGYTYAAELSADEAGTSNVEFTQPVYVYVDNFLNFPIGETVPSGYYDREKGAWVASDNGRIVKVLGVTGGLADLDVDGSGAPADEAKRTALDVTDDERRRLGETYAAGRSLWRVPIKHMTPYDFNWPVVPPPGAEAPGEGPTAAAAPKNPDEGLLDNPCKERVASWVDCENQSLGEAIPVAGTPFSLVYQSDRVWGRNAARTIEIPLTGAVLPGGGAKRVDVEVLVAGVKWNRSFAPEVSKSTAFVWDGKDRYGRPVRGYQAAEVTVSYVYDTVYMSVGDRLRAFGERGASSVALTAAPVEIFKSRKTLVPVYAMPPASAGLGGWAIEPHHVYQSHNQTLLLGDGRRRTTQGISMSLAGEIGRIASSVFSFEEGYGLAADEAGDVYLQGLSDAKKLQRDGSAGYLFGSLGGGIYVPGLPQPPIPGVAVVRPEEYYVADVMNHQVLKIAHGSIQKRLGWPGAAGYTITDNETFSWTVFSLQDMAYVFDAFLRQPIFPFDTDYEKLRKVLLAMGYAPEQVGAWPDGFALVDAYYAVAGGYGGDGVPAEGAKLLYPMGLAVDAGGNLYIADTGNHRVRRVDADGVITTVAGNGNGAYAGDNGPATQANLNHPMGVAVDAEGNLYIADTDNHRVRKVDVEGVITTVAGDGQSGFSGDGGPATLARLNRPTAVTVDREGHLYIADYDNNRVRRVMDGTMQTAGLFNKPTGVVVDGDDRLVVADRGLANGFGYGFAKKLLPPLPGYKTGDFYIPSEDGGEVYLFSAAGRHLKTLGAKTGALIHDFTYTPDGYLSKVTDGDGNETTIERDGAGNPTAVVAPYGQRTELKTDLNGWLTEVADPAGGKTAMAYGEGGLMTSFADPNGHRGTMAYDALGRLAEDKGASGKTWTSARAALSSGHEVSMTTAKGFVSRYTVEPQATGELKRVITSPWGSVSGILRRTDGSTRVETADGTVREGTKTADPRWGAAAALPAGTVTLGSGLTRVTGVTRQATTADASNPMSLLTETTTFTVNGRNYVMVYSSATRTVEEITPGSRRLGKTLDGRGRVVEERYRSLAALKYTYDVRGRMSVVRQGPRETLLAYNAGGYLSGVRDAVGRQVTFATDALGRVTRQTMADGRLVDYGYDANGNVTALTPPGRGEHRFTYGAGDLPGTYVTPLGATTRYDYDEDAQLKTLTRPGGDTVTVTRDAAGRMGSMTTGAGATTYAYDAAGRLGERDGAGGVGLAYAYDGDLVTGAELTGPVAGRVDRTYDADFRTAGVSVNGGGTTVYAYDVDGLLTAVGAMTLARDAANGQVTGTTLGVVTDERTYNDHGEPTGYLARAGGTAVLELAYTRDGVGRMTAKTETIQGTTANYAYFYDVAGRLVRVEKNGVGVEQYTYDANGNRTSGTVGGTTLNGTYDGDDKVAVYGGSAYAHAAGGEWRTVTEGGKRRRTTMTRWGTCVG